MAQRQVRGFVARCEAAATWRASLAGKHDDDASLRTAQRLRGEVLWARANPTEAAKVLTRFRKRGLDFTQAWEEPREYTFTTHCLDGDETREQWLTRVLDAGC